MNPDHMWTERYTLMRMWFPIRLIFADFFSFRNQNIGSIWIHSYHQLDQNRLSSVVDLTLNFYIFFSWKSIKFHGNSTESKILATLPFLDLFRMSWLIILAPIVNDYLNDLMSISWKHSLYIHTKYANNQVKFQFLTHSLFRSFCCSRNATLTPNRLNVNQ